MATKDIRIFTRPDGNPYMELSGSEYSSIRMEVQESGSVAWIGDSGSLFSITDDFSSSLMSVNDISGLPILEVFTDDRVVMGSYGQNTLVVTGSMVGIGTAVPEAKLQVYESTVLGGSNGDVQLLQTTTGKTSNVFYNRIWLRRDATGTDWLTSRLHDAISIDSSYETPGTDTKTWYERDPYNNIHQWGSSATTYMTIDAGDVGIGTTNPSHLLHIWGGNLGMRSTSDGSNGIIRFYDDEGDESGQIYASNDDLRIYGHTDITILPVGSVGIGTDVPQNDLHLYTTADTTMLIQSTTDNAGIIISADTANSATTYDQDPRIQFFSANTLRYAMYHDEDLGGFAFNTTLTGNQHHMFINSSSGYVGVGATSVDEILHVQKDQNTATMVKIENNTGGTLASAQLGLYTNSGYGRLAMYDDGYSNADFADRLVLWTGTSSHGTIKINTRGYGDLEFALQGDTTEHIMTSGGDVGIGTTVPTEKLTLVGNFNQTTTDQYLYNTYVSGIAGTGWQLGYNSNGSYFEVDNVMVRNSLRTHIFQKDVVKATNGYLWISDSGVISGSTGTSPSGTVVFEDAKSATFGNNEQLWYKEVDPDSGTITSVKFTINGTGTSSGGFTTYNVDGVIGDLSNLQPGGTAARISGGTILLDASSTYSPFIDVNESSGSAVVRMGNLEGITSPTFGALGAVYGFWASGSAYFEGTVNATQGGIIGGWTIGTGSLYSENLRLDSDNVKIIAGNGGSDIGTGTLRAVMGKYNGTDYGFRVWDGTNTFVELSSNGTNKISNWYITPTQLYNTGSNGGIVMNASTKQIDVHSDPSTLRVRMGDVGTNQYGIKGWDASSNMVFEISEVQNVIAGWDLKEEYIGKGQVSMSYADTAFLVNEGAYNRVLMGKLGGKFGTPASTYGFILGDGNGHSSANNVLVELSDNRNVIAGWELSQDKIGKGQVSMSYVDTSFIVNEGAYNKVRMGSLNGKFGLSGGEYGFILGDGTADSSADNVLVELSDNRNYIAGWTITSGSIEADGGTAILAGVGYLSLGQGTAGYNQTGAWLEGTNNGRLSLRGSNGRMLWDSSKLMIQDGGASVTVFQTTDSGSIIAGWAIDDTKISKPGTHDIVLDSANAKIYIGDGTYNDGNTPFYVDATGQFSIGDALTFQSSSGDLTVTGTVYANAGSFTGNVSAATGNIGNWNITSGELASGTDIVLNATDTRIELADGAMMFGYGVGGSGNHGVYLDANNYWYSSGSFQVYADSSNQISFDGSNLTISATTFEMSATGVSISSSGKRFTAGSSNNIVIMDGDEGIWAGNASFASAPFSVTLGGALVASNATISGDIIATHINVSSGSIANWTIGSNTLTGGNIELKQNGYIKIGSLSSETDTSDTSTGAWFSNDGTFLLKAGGANTGYLQGTSGGDFIMSGSLYATYINASTAGKISNWIIESDRMYYDIESDRHLKILAGYGTDDQEGFEIYRDDGDISTGDVKVVNLGKLRNIDQYNAYSSSADSDYGLEVIKNQTTDPVKHIVRIGGDQAMIAGWDFDEENFYKDNIYLSTNDSEGVSSLYINSGSARVSVRVAEGDFSVDVDNPSEILGNPSFETNNTAWTGSATKMDGSNPSYDSTMAYHGTKSYYYSGSIDTAIQTGSMEVHFHQITGGDSFDKLDTVDFSIHSYLTTTTKYSRWSWVSLDLCYSSSPSGPWTCVGQKTFQASNEAWKKYSISGVYNGNAGTVYWKPIVSASVWQKEKGGYAAEARFDSGSLKQSAGGNKTELTEKGLLIFNGYDNFLKFDDTGLKIKTVDAEISSLTSDEVIASSLEITNIFTEDLSGTDPAVGGAGQTAQPITIQVGGSQNAADTDQLGADGADLWVIAGAGGDAGPASNPVIGVSGGTGGNLYLHAGTAGQYSGDGNSNIGDVDIRSRQTRVTGSISIRGDMDLYGTSITFDTSDGSPDTNYIRGSYNVNQAIQFSNTGDITLTAYGASLGSFLKLKGDNVQKYVGINTNSPQAALHIYSGSDASIILDCGGTDWVMGIDDSQTDRFTITTGQDVNDSTPAFTIETNGDVGIGTTNPLTPLYVYTSDEDVAAFRSTDTTARIAIQDPSDVAYVISSGAKLSMGMANSVSTNNLTVNTSGYVGIGSTSPTQRLDVNGDITASGYRGYMTHIITSCFNTTNTGKSYIPFNSLTDSTTQGEQTKLVMPYDGKVKKISMRMAGFNAGGAPNDIVVVGFHKASDGTTNPSSTATENQNFSMTAAHTTVTNTFSSSTFTAGQVIGFSIDPLISISPGDVNITVVLELDIDD